MTSHDQRARAAHTHPHPIDGTHEGLARDCYCQHDGVSSDAAPLDCEGYNVNGRWLDCDRTDAHGHGILADYASDAEPWDPTECCGARMDEPCKPWCDNAAHGAYPVEE